MPVTRGFQIEGILSQGNGADAFGELEEPEWVSFST